MRRLGTCFAVVAGLLLTLGTPADVSAQEGTELKVDPAHSNFMIRAKHLGVAYTFVEFTEMSGTVVVNDEEPSKSSVDLTVKADSFESHHEKRNKHVKGQDFLNAKKYPEITFESKKVEKKNDETWKVTGDLTIRDTTKSITVDVKHFGSTKGPEGKTHHGFYTEFEINRLDFGIDWKPDAGVVGKSLRLIISIEAVTG